jgi:spectinomycin phosphotransferase
MREDPGLDVDGFSTSIEKHYGPRVVSVIFLPLGYDPNAAVYEVVSRDGTSYFLKVRFGPVHEASLLVPRALIDLGISNVLAPCRRDRLICGARSVAILATAPCSTRS